MQLSVFTVFSIYMTLLALPSTGLFMRKNRKLKEKKKIKSPNSNKSICTLKFGFVLWLPLTIHPPKWNWSISLKAEKHEFRPRLQTLRIFILMTFKRSMNSSTSVIKPQKPTRKKPSPHLLCSTTENIES